MVGTRRYRVYYLLRRVLKETAPSQRHIQGLKVPTRFILEQVGGVESISGIHFDLRDRLGGVLRAPLTPRRARVTNASSREKSPIYASRRTLSFKQVAEMVSTPSY